jgi:WD40 repeat protein
VLDANIQLQAVDIQVDATKSIADHLAGRSLLGLVQSIRAGRKSQKLGISRKRNNAQLNIEAAKAIQQATETLSYAYNIRERNIIKSDQGILNSVNFSPDGERIISGGYDGTIKLWRRDGTFINAFKGAQGKVSSVSFSPDGERIISGGYDGTIKLWRHDGTFINAFKGAQGTGQTHQKKY